MDARELRIGNYATDSIETGAITVFNNDACVLKHKSGIVKCRISDLQPIPLTKEWLLKFGFEQQKWGDFILTYYRKGNILYSLSDGNVELNEPNICLTQLKHVHQLQNLYFALTGEELTIKN